MMPDRKHAASVENKEKTAGNAATQPQNIHFLLAGGKQKKTNNYYCQFGEACHEDFHL